MNITFIEIGKRIKTIRNNAKLEQDEFGKIFDVGNQTVSNWETGRKKPDLANLAAIAKYGNVTLDWLITGIDPKEKLTEEIKSKDIFIAELLKRYGELSVQSEKDLVLDVREHLGKKKHLK